MARKNTLQIENFGSIKDAKIEVAPLTVFVGPNNSGKTYASLAIHSFKNLLSKIESLNKNLQKDISFLASESLLKNIPEEEFEPFNIKFTDYVDSKPTMNSEPLRIPIKEFDPIYKYGIGLVYSSLVEENMQELFETDLNELIRFNQDFFKLSYNNITLAYGDSLNLKNLPKDFKIELGNFEGKFFGFEINQDEIYININYALLNNMFNENLKVEEVFLLFYSYLSRAIFNVYFNEQSHYIPVGKTEISKNLSLALSKNLDNEFTFSNTQKRFAQKLLEINKSRKNGYFYDLACKFEHELFGGEIFIKDDDSPLKDIFYKRDDGLKIPLSQASSSISEMTPLILYLKYILKENDTLIIEEPEAHLHPKNQRILVKYFVLAINMGLNIIMTTHSDYIIEQLNNYIRLGNVNDEFYEHHDNYSKDQVLDFNKIKLYHFKQSEDYTFSPFEVPINFTGFYDKNFNEVIDDLCDEGETIVDYKLR